MKIQFQISFPIIIASILLLPALTIPVTSLADGMLIMPDPYSDRWDYSNETNQQAFINYEQGLEKMILSIGINANSKNSVWIFPVPAQPNKTVIDIVTKLPRLNGEEVTRKGKLNLFNIKRALPASQIYTIPFIAWRRMILYRGVGNRALGISMESNQAQAIERDVVVYEHLEKEGISTEIITAKTANGIYQYLQKKGLVIEQGSIPVLEHYIGKKFTFVVSWISENKLLSAKLRFRQRGVFVTFPTQKIYYPLFPTSVYGSKVVPASIRIFGYRSPEIFQDIKNYTKTEYFIDNYADLGSGLENFYNGPTKNIKYTKIEINAPSKFLTEDLWINQKPPLKTYYSLFIAKHWLITGIVLLILSSIISSIIAGWIVFKKLRNKNGILRLVLLGLSNCLFVVALMATTALFRTKAKDKNTATLLNEIRQNGYVWRRKLAVILFFSVLPFSIFGVIVLLTIIEPTLRYGFPTEYTMPVIIGCVIPILVLAFISFLKRIKEEDRPLFAQLKLVGYSSWSFNPKDKMKFIFVPLFSVSFLAVSWLIIELLQFTL